MPWISTRERDKQSDTGHGRGGQSAGSICKCTRAARAPPNTISSALDISRWHSWRNPACWMTVRARAVARLKGRYDRWAPKRAPEAWARRDFLEEPKMPTPGRRWWWGLREDATVVKGSRRRFDTRGLAVRASRLQPSDHPGWLCTSHALPIKLPHRAPRGGSRAGLLVGRLQRATNHRIWRPTCAGRPRQPCEATAFIRWSSSAACARHRLHEAFLRLVQRVWRLGPYCSRRKESHSTPVAAVSRPHWCPKGAAGPVCSLLTAMYVMCAAWPAAHAHFLAC